jgi:hypothetical protein
VTLPPDIFDRDAKFSADVISTVKQNGTKPVRTAFRSPWQNGIAERGSEVCVAICSTT